MNSEKTNHNKKIFELIKAPPQNWTGRKEYVPKDKINHPTVKLIYHIVKKLEIHPKIIKIFGKEHSKAWLSRIFGKYRDYILDILRGKTKTITESNLNNAINNLEKEFGSLAKKAIKLIKNFIPISKTASTKDNKEFINKLFSILNEIHIEITPTLAGIIIFNDKYKINNYLKHFKNSYKETSFGNQDFYFDLETLEVFKHQIEVLLGNDSSDILKLINLYKKEYKDKISVGLHHRVGDKRYFNEIFTFWLSEYLIVPKINYNGFSNNKFNSILDKYYWIGYLMADGWITESEGRREKRIGFSQKLKDGHKVEKFILSIKLEGSLEDNVKIRKRKRIYRGKMKIFNEKIARFGCKYMVNVLKQLGFVLFKKNKIGLPAFIKVLIKNAKIEAGTKNIEKWGKTRRGKMALSFLMGFYDGDGSKGGLYSAKIYNSNKRLLEEIKIHFGSSNKVFQNRDGVQKEREYLKELDAEDMLLIQSKKPYYSLSLGLPLFRAMLDTYENSLKRKRP
jgi:arsenate reductase-like glutaredoxin family protein